MAALHAEHSRPLFHFLLGLTNGERHTAEDLLQETMLRAWRYLDAVPDDAWDTVLDVNLIGAFRCARAFAPQLRASHGAMVNIGSIAAHRAVGSSIVYGVSKAALAQLTRALARARSTR